MQNKHSFNPTNTKHARDHRPLAWWVKQYFTEPEDGEFCRHEVWTGYSCALERNPKSASALSMAKSNISRFGGELYANYGDEWPVLVENF